ncbi:MAG TPA: hypothetical protein VNW47_17090 [Terriglobales bacterium]|nr:hypothetical protein [Terriglobales bacterium]
MRIIRITSTSILALFLGVAAPVYAQHDQQGEKQDHQEQKQEQHEQAKPESQHAQQRPSEQKQTQNNQQQEHAQQPRQAQNNQHQERAQQQSQAKNNQHAQQQHPQQQKQSQDNQQHAQQQRTDRPRSTPEQQRVQQSAWQQHRSQHWESDHRTWQQRGGYHGYRIPDDRYRGYFGRDHEFRIYGLPFLVVGGYPRFQYSGYWFSPVDPWPEYWGANWYDNDDVYVMYVDNGYYMYNRRYPSEGIAIRISL